MASLRLTGLIAAFAAPFALALALCAPAAADDLPALPPLPTTLPTTLPSLPAPGSPDAAVVTDALTGAALAANGAGPQGFFYPAPTIGCGAAGIPVTMTLASANVGPAVSVTPPVTVPEGQVLYQAAPDVGAIAPTSSALQLVWVNTTTSQVGIAALDNTLSTLVDPGRGTVYATLFGTVTYGSVTCTVAPTVGSATV